MIVENRDLVVLTGRGLTVWMAERDVTCAALGDALGVTERTVYRWRASRDIPRIVGLALITIEARL